MLSTRLIAFLAVTAAAVGCSPAQPVSTRATPQAAPKAVVEEAPKNPAALGTLDGAAVTLNDIDPAIRADLIDLENELEQRRMHLRWVGFENAVNERLLDQEAKARGVSVEELLETVASAVEVSDDQIRELYDANKDAIPVSFEEARSTIRSQLEESERQRAVRAFSEELRQGAKIDYRADVPELPRYEIDVTDQPVLGGEQAKVTIVEFSDFECPYCSRAREVLSELRKSYGDRVRLVYRDFPLSQHPNARPAAAAAHCALEQGRFWEFHDALFDHADTLDDDAYQKLGEELGLDMDGFASCLASERPAAAIAADESDAQRLGVQGTPAIFINGVKLIGLLPLPIMKSIIDHELESS